MKYLYQLLVFICFSILSVNGAFCSEIKPTEQKKIIKIATGNVLGSYYSIGIRLCSYIEEKLGVKCDVVPSHGSRENIELLRLGEVDFAFTTSLFALDAYEGVGSFSNKKPITDLLQIFTLHDEMFTLLAKDDDQILSLADLAGKRVASGLDDSDTNYIYTSLIDSYQLPSPPVTIQTHFEKYADDFCSSKVDVIAFMSSHPSSIVSHITNNCDAEFVMIGDKVINEMIRKSRGLKIVSIDPKQYPGITELQKTVASPAIFLTKKGVFETNELKNIINKFDKHLKEITHSHPCLYNINTKDMTEGFFLPDARNH